MRIYSMQGERIGRGLVGRRFDAGGAQLRPPRIDLDDSFRDVSTDIGWLVRIGVEASLTAARALRLDAAYLDFGRRAY